MGLPWPSQLYYADNVMKILEAPLLPSLSVSPRSTATRATPLGASPETDRCLTLPSYNRTEASGRGVVKVGGKTHGVRALHNSASRGSSRRRQAAAVQGGLRPQMSGGDAGMLLNTKVMSSIPGIWTLREGRRRTRLRGVSGLESTGWRFRCGCRCGIFRADQQSHDVSWNQQIRKLRSYR
jgi:hypothetical protein